MLPIERHCPVATREMAFISPEFSCANIHILSSEPQEFEYTVPAHRFCLNIAGGTNRTEVFHDGRKSYSGNDRAELLTVVPAGADRRSILKGADLEYIRFEVCEKYFQRMARSLFRKDSHFAIRPIDNQDVPRLQAIGLEMRESLFRSHDALSLDLLAASFARVVLAMSGYRDASPSVWGLDARALRRVRDYVYGHLDGIVRLEALAAESGLSPMPFIRAFRASTGRTPGQFLVAARMERAKELLMDSDLSVFEVAVRVGYRTHSHFSAAFRSALGETPTEYRRHRRR